MKPSSLLLVLLSLTSSIRCDGGTQALTQSQNMFNDITLEGFDRVTRDKDIMLIFFYLPR